MHSHLHPTPPHTPLRLGIYLLILVSLLVYTVSGR